MVCVFLPVLKQSKSACMDRKSYSESISTFDRLCLSFITLTDENWYCSISLSLFSLCILWML